MIQLEFQSLIARLPHCPRRKRKRKLSAMGYTLRLAATLRVLNLTHSIHDVLCGVAKLEYERGYATIPAICMRLACTYQAVMQQFLKNPEIFRRDDSHSPARYTLTPEGLRLLARINQRIKQCHE